MVTDRDSNPALLDFTQTLSLESLSAIKVVDLVRFELTMSFDDWVTANSSTPTLAQTYLLL